MAYLRKFVFVLSQTCDRIAQVGLVGMMVLVTANIILRPFGWPIFGTYDYVQLIGAILVSFAVAYCAAQKGHIQVELVMTRFSKRIQAVVGVITGLLSLGMFGLVTWQLVVFSGEKLQSGETSMGAYIPLYPFVYAVGFGFVVFFLVILVEFIKSVVEAVRR